MPRKTVRIMMVLCTFLGGLYFAKFANTKNFNERSLYQNPDSTFSANQTLAYIGDTSISTEDIDWEYVFYTTGLMEKDNLTPIPDILNNLDSVLLPLKKQLAATMIERVLLFKYIQQDKSFDSQNPGRYTECLKEWQKAIDDLPSKIDSPRIREKFKTRLCEKSLLDQYLSEVIFKKIRINEQEINEYFLKNQANFYEPEKVLIRQIVLPSETLAKKIKRKITKSNFAFYARNKSITPEASKDGLLGPFAKGDLPRVFDVSFSMKVGEIRGVLKSTYGFHIIKLEKRYKATKLPLARARKKIKSILVKNSQQEEYQKWVELALNSVPIKSPKSLW